METQQTPFSDIGSRMQGMGTATALENIELGEEVPVAVNLNEVNREATRWLVFAGDKMVPSQKRERPDLRTGGEYYGQQFKTLIRSKGLVRRCQITPMEVGFDFMSNDMIGDDANLHIDSTVNHDTPGAPVGQLNGVKVYPGDELKGILQAERNNTNSGIVEVSTLAGVTYPDFKASGVQEFIFPEWAKIMAGIANFPVKLSELQNHLTTRKQATSDTAIKDIIGFYESSCDQYRIWGMNYLKMASQLVRLPANQGFVHAYSELAEMLFDSLEVRREDMLSTDRDIADIVAKASAGNSISGGEVTALLAKMTDVMTHLAGQGIGVEVKATCAGIKADGEKCNAAPIENSDRCRHHQEMTN